MAKKLDRDVGLRDDGLRFMFSFHKSFGAICGGVAFQFDDNYALSLCLSVSSVFIANKLLLYRYISRIGLLTTMRDSLNFGPNILLHYINPHISYIFHCIIAGSREIRDTASSEVLSAPTSPGENNQIGTQIGRNPLRGSKRNSPHYPHPNPKTATETTNQNKTKQTAFCAWYYYLVFRIYCDLDSIIYRPVDSNNWRGVDDCGI